jgi:2-(1,2-epoxy-1,2-dihydrophenyl)acetyl-CoA isomerase
LMMASDFVFASEKAYFNLAYIRLGLCPDGFVTYWLPRKVGLTRAMSMALLGQTISPEVAKDSGLINDVVPVEALNEHAEACVHALCQQSQLALRHTKQLLRQSLESTMAQQSMAELKAFGNCVENDDFIEGVSAFIQKRKPDFQSQS